VLINNAAVMSPPVRGVSADGYEMQLATNYLGHFALTGLLMPLLRQSDDGGGQPVEHRCRARSPELR